MKRLVSLVDDLITQMLRTEASASVEAVHDLRVSVRRVAEGLRIYRNQVPNARRFAKEIKSIRNAAAAVRDRDVTRQLLRRHRLPAADPGLCYLQGQRDLAATQLQESLRGHLLKERPQRWRRWLEVQP